MFCVVNILVSAQYESQLLHARDQRLLVQAIVNKSVEGDDLLISELQASAKCVILA